VQISTRTSVKLKPDDDVGSGPLGRRNPSKSEISSLSTPLLKLWCSRLNLVNTGARSILVRRILGHFEHSSSSPSLPLLFSSQPTAPLMMGGSSPSIFRDNSSALPSSSSSQLPPVSSSLPSSSGPSTYSSSSSSSSPSSSSSSSSSTSVGSSQTVSLSADFLVEIQRMMSRTLGTFEAKIESKFEGFISH
jgi:hypothetical protein